MSEHPDGDCADGGARNVVSFRPGQPACCRQSWAPAPERSSHVGGLCPWCRRAGSSPCRSSVRRAAWPPVPGAPRAGCCPAGSAGCLPPPWPGCAVAASRSSSPGAVPHPPVVRAPCLSRCPRPSPGGIRYTARHQMIARLSVPGPPGVGMIPAQASPAPSPPWPGSDGTARASPELPAWPGGSGTGGLPVPPAGSS